MTRFGSSLLGGSGLRSQTPQRQCASPESQPTSTTHSSSVSSMALRWQRRCTPAHQCAQHLTFPSHLLLTSPSLPSPHLTFPSQQIPDVFAIEPEYRPGLARALGGTAEGASFGTDKLPNHFPVPVMPNGESYFRAKCIMRATTSAISASGYATFEELVLSNTPIPRGTFPRFPIEDRDVHDVDFENVCRKPLDKVTIEELVCSTSQQTQDAINSIRQAVARGRHSDADAPGYDGDFILRHVSDEHLDTYVEVKVQSSLAGHVDM